MIILHPCISVTRIVAPGGDCSCRSRFGSLFTWDFVFVYLFHERVLTFY